MSEKTASGLSPRVLQNAIDRVKTVPEAKHIIDMANTAVEACRRTRVSIEETREYAETALRATIKAGELLEALERPGRGQPRKNSAAVAEYPWHKAIKDAEVPERTAYWWQEVARAAHLLSSYLDSVDGEDVPSGRGLVGLLQDPGGTKSSVSVEWYTPARYIEAARSVMGGIDLDPASSEIANETVKAETYFAEQDEPDGLSQDWFGRVWLNPPYGKGSGLFTSKLAEEFDAGRVSAGVLLLNAYGFDADWFEPLWAHPICFTDHRIEFYSPQRESGGPANGNIFVYLGRAEKRFAEVFGPFGHVVRAWP